MTVLGIITDVHADVHTLREALDAMLPLGVERFLCCGDITDYGDFPEETIALLQERNVTCIRGNHDRWNLDMPRGLSGDAMRYIMSLPAGWTEKIDGVKIALTHGSPWSDMDGLYPNMSDDEIYKALNRSGADVLFAGHTHIPMKLCTLGGKMVINTGSLLLNMQTSLMGVREIRRCGTFGVLPLPDKTFSLHKASGVEVPIETRTLGVVDRR